MKKIFRNILILIAFGAMFFVFRNPIESAYFLYRDKFFPCSFPIKYSIGSFDSRFEISEEEFLNSIEMAEKIWEDAIDKDLFVFDPNGDLKINLFYDDRQEITEKLSDLDFKMESDRNFYDNLFSEYETLKKNYFAEKEEIENKIIAFQVRQIKYEKEVNYWNLRGGATKKEFDRLNEEANNLKKEALILNNQQANLNLKIGKINEIARQINNFALKLNIQTEKYNKIGGELGEEFEEGLYTQDSFGRRIDIYQFENKNNLVRLLAHEMGHALSLEHLDNPGAMMYRLNVGGDFTLSEEDISMLKDHCRIK